MFVLWVVAEGRWFFLFLRRLRLEMVQTSGEGELKLSGG